MDKKDIDYGLNDIDINDYKLKKNNNGKIIYKHAGKLTEKIIKKEIFSYLNDLK